ncbi:DUF2306 domain-containing protein [Actinotalea sp. BY-33]|uniref:DUF2306 domain-containing protein n=1 Tax=Actinotalea soli TaxID=2819234 RepID=A0A939LRI5_9CELL|nr:DUF2306 domain-containing protein [Actinotalea soli]MBO1752759.1 DUF2306 domain-containing protein [Actinotalea soli]
MSDVTAPPRSTAAKSTRRDRWPRRERWAVTGLLALSTVPVLAGAIRVGELASGAVMTEANARFVSDPAPVVIHIVTATVFSVLGAFQLMPSYRRRNLRRHRMTGRVVAPAGLVAALSGVWMTVFYATPAPDGVWLAVVRLVVGVCMAASIVLGVRAAVRRDIRSHRGWMIRGYAIGVGAGTQVLTSVPLLLADGLPTELWRTATMALGWLINAVIGEVIIWRGRARSVSPLAR